MVRIPYGTKYTVKVSGSMWKPVTCENCKCQFLYQVKHQTTGSATNVLWLNKEKAMCAAQENANKNLETYLKKAVRNYVCPDCGFYQREMIERMKKGIWLKGLITGAITFIIVSWLMSEMSPSSNILYGFWAGGIGCMFFLRKLINYNPNTDANIRKSRKFSESYPVLKKSDLEKAYQLQQFRKS